MIPSDIPDSGLKVERALVHISNLQGAIRTFINGSYGIEVDEDPNTFEYILYGKVLNKDIPYREWGLLIGDAINNLRSALDNSIWELTVINHTPPADPIPFNSKWRHVRFPIIIHPDRWPNAETRNLWGIRPRLRASIKLLQPFVTGENAPQREPLAVLDELWNIDKHRHLHLTNCFVGLDEVLSRMSDLLPPQAKILGQEYKILSKKAPGHSKMAQNWEDLPMEVSSAVFLRK